MKTAPIHWLLLVCILATPLSSHGQVGATAGLAPHEIAAAFAHWTGQPQRLRLKRISNRLVQPSSPVTQAIGSTHPDLSGHVLVAGFTPESTALPSRRSETPTSQPAGP